MESSENGLTYKEIKTQTGLSDTGLTKLLKRLDLFDLLVKAPNGGYHITNLGMQYLMSLKTVEFSLDLIRKKYRSAFLALWNQVYQVHEKARRIDEKSADRWSKMMRDASYMKLYNPDLIWVAAFKGKDGRKYLSIRPADVEDLRKLGYSPTQEHKELDHYGKLREAKEILEN